MDDANTLNDLVASEIRAWLGRRRMTGRQLAAKIGKSQTWMATRLRGETELGVNDLSLIAGGLNVGVPELLPVPARRTERGQTGQASDRIAYRPQGHDPTRPPAGRPPNRPTTTDRTAESDSHTPVTSRTRAGRPTVHPYHIGGVKS
jgi:transcriptional regulator with XRE-family HTH domain